MDIFEFRNKLITDYSNYIKSFINIADDKISELLESEFKRGLLWPSPLIQMNPTFVMGNDVAGLIKNGTLHPKCAEVFCDKATKEPYKLYLHQEEAIKTAQSNHNYVLTTGTGSGKSLTYIIPIVDHVLKTGSGKGTKAIIIYPMNALANSQFGELEKFLCAGFPDKKGPVTFARYTGQESEEDRRRIWENPPDIILTNFVMMELILTRPEENPLISAAATLKFLVLDELHTYRGRQGADVAMLIRRMRNYFGAGGFQCVGTSATMFSGGSEADSKKKVAEVASLLFGAEVKDKNVIGETVKKLTLEADLESATFKARLTEKLKAAKIDFPAKYEDFVSDPLIIWIENNFGIQKKDGKWVRATPLPIEGDEGAVKKLAKETGATDEKCREALLAAFNSGIKVTIPNTDRPVFAFKLHQFISKGENVYASLETEKARHLTLNPQPFVPNSDKKKILIPMGFCRECGQAYYIVVRLTQKDGTVNFEPRSLFDRYAEEDIEPGFLYLNSENKWPDKIEDIIERIPEDWTETVNGQVKIKRSQRDKLPLNIFVDTSGKLVADSSSGQAFSYIHSPFPFCLNCGVAYSARTRSDVSKLTTLDVGGRSTATTILTLSTVKILKTEGEIPPDAKKLLSFTDNRQDASLQAGHFNDFVEIGLLRSAIYRAAAAAMPTGLKHEELGEKVFNALSLDIGEFSKNPNVRHQAKVDVELALKKVLSYRAYRDLKRGWRVTVPNLEHCGLLEIDYPYLKPVCEDADMWKGNKLLSAVSPELRYEISKALIDFFRRSLAIDVEYLKKERFDQIKQNSEQHLLPPWGLDEEEKCEYAAFIFPRSRAHDDSSGDVYLSTKSNFAGFCKRHLKAALGVASITSHEMDLVIQTMLSVLTDGGLLASFPYEAEDHTDHLKYQLKASAMLWKSAPGTETFHDPLRVPRKPSKEFGAETNKYFVEFYTKTAIANKGIKAREHTAQVPAEVREDREKNFREGRLPVLFCSPTMELGIDIKNLNIVNMRNVPPSPANYAQRGGRAGRHGQPALVFTYCATGSYHDQYFFRRQRNMVAGSVTPPKIDLANEDLLRSHCYAVLTKETGKSLGKTLSEVLDLSGEPPSRKIKAEFTESFTNSAAITRAKAKCSKVIDSIALDGSGWYKSNWLDEALTQAANRFSDACDRWRSLHKAAYDQLQIQNRVISDATKTPQERERARRLHQEANVQLSLLLQSDNVYQSDFYSYRYFASEGFLPGYNFPRLPLSAFIPARSRLNNKDEFLSRSRFLAISEFGPRAIIYHEGSRYMINRVMLPVGTEVLNESAKFCPSCGYLHKLFDGEPGPDKCQRCGTLLEPAAKVDNLLRLQNVVTRRRDRINSDEEERFRLGYEIRSYYRFEEVDNHPVVRKADIVAGGEVVAEANYGPATLWRVNMGWLRRKNSQPGFCIDIDKGYWVKDPVIEDEEEAADDSPQAVQVKRVIPYVFDHKNTLVIEPKYKFADGTSDAAIITLQYALKRAIQAVYQLEDAEIAVELLPPGEEKKLILMYESAEGGAGVLRQIIEDPQALPSLARKALEICHFDPKTGEDKGHSPYDKENCESACYDCLLSYSNQRDHMIIDRRAIKDVLLAIANSEIKASSTHLSREEQYTVLQRTAGSSLEKEWLEFIQKNGYRLPTCGQKLFEKCSTRPDFIYEHDNAVVYVDGPVHENPERARRDTAQTEAMRDSGYVVIRFSHRDDWHKIVESKPNIFGIKK